MYHRRHVKLSPMPKELKELEPLINKCVLCGGCHPDCPTYTLSRYEHDAARGKVLLAQALLKGELPPSPELAQKFDHCLTCMACTQACPAGADPAKVIVAARNEVRKGIGGGFIRNFIFAKILPNRLAMPFLAAAMKIGSRLFSILPWLPGMGKFTVGGDKKILPEFFTTSLKSEYPQVVPAAGKRLMRVAYFTGCMADWVFQKSGRGVIGILSSAGADVLLVKDEVCCGAPAYFSGDMVNAGLMAEKNLKAFMAMEVDYIVTSCATCGSVLKEIYPELLGGADAQKFSAKIIDFQKLLVDRLMPKIPAPTGAEPKIKVTYHDPCHLSRGMKVVAEPHRLLQKLPGVEYVEMADANACCGGAGTFSASFYADSLEIGKRKAQNIMASGAQIVVTECPSCQMQLMDLMARYAPGVKVLHTAELLAKVLTGR